MGCGTRSIFAFASGGFAKLGYNARWRAPAHCGVTNLVRSGTKQPQSFPVSAADQARLFQFIWSSDRFPDSLIHFPIV